MAKIVWVFGGSAAGKQTFIRRIITERPPDILSALGWHGGTIGACIPSLAWIAHYQGDMVATRRSRLPLVVRDMAEMYDVVLVKGQDWDLKRRLPQKIKQLLPHAEHSVVFIDIDLDEMYRRIVRKKWWDSRTRRAEEEGWLEEQIDFLNELAASFAITTINGNSGGHYEIVPFSRPFG